MVAPKLLIFCVVAGLTGLRRVRVPVGACQGDGNSSPVQCRAGVRSLSCGKGS